MSTNNPTPSDRRRGSRKSALKAAVKPKYKPAARAPPPPARNTKESQEILDLFHHAFSTLFTPQLPELLQKVKTHLFNRDFLEAFGARENLEAYVVRWSPSRALCYREVFLELSPALRRVFELKDGERVEVVCIGGGAGAEVVAVAAAVKSLLGAELASAPAPAPAKGEEQSGEDKDEVEVDEEPEEAGEGSDEAKGLENDLESLTLTSDPPTTTTTTTPSTPSRSLHMTAIDIADWTTITTTLTTALTTAPAPTRPAFIPRSLYTVDFHHHDILTPCDTPLIPPTARLITLLFTTNELYTQSRAATTRFLLSLKDRVQAGCLLLVLESAGSYSTVLVNGKTFPMGMLLDHTLLAGDVWERVLGEDAKWFRLPEGLRYPIEIENMRFMVRVYRKT